MKVINENFTIGERYIGMVNNVPFRVTGIKQPGDYPTAHGIIYTLRQPHVEFLNEADGQEHVEGLEITKRLLLR